LRLIPQTAAVRANRLVCAFMCRYVTEPPAPRTLLSMDVADLDGNGVLEFIVSIDAM